MARVIDLNADVGEGVDGDLELLAVVTSASVACGFHAGDDSTMRALCEEAVAREVAIGAHVGYRDREGFGRRDLDVAPATVEAETIEQISALESHAAEAGGRVAYVKPHGALYHRASVDGECAAAIVSALRAVDDGLAVLAAPRLGAARPGRGCRARGGRGRFRRPGVRARRVARAAQAAQARCSGPTTRFDRRSRSPAAVRFARSACTATRPGRSSSRGEWRRSSRPPASS